MKNNLLKRIPMLAFCMTMLLSCSAPAHAKDADSKTVTYKAETSGITVTVTADEGVLPEGAQLTVKELSGTERDEGENILKENGVEYDKTLPLDVSFVVNGQEVEPADEVEVCIEYDKAKLGDGIDASSVKIEHLAENPATGEVEKVETVAEGSGSDAGVYVDGDNVKAEFGIESFSVVALVSSNRDYINESRDGLIYVQCLETGKMFNDSSTLYLKNKSLRTVQEIVNAIKNKGWTKGYYFRGVGNLHNDITRFYFDRKYGAWVYNTASGKGARAGAVHFYYTKIPDLTINQIDVSGNSIGDSAATYTYSETEYRDSITEINAYTVNKYKFTKAVLADSAEAAAKSSITVSGVKWNSTVNEWQYNDGSQWNSLGNSKVYFIYEDTPLLVNYIDASGEKICDPRSYDETDETSVSEIAPLFTADLGFDRAVIAKANENPTESTLNAVKIRAYNGNWQYQNTAGNWINIPSDSKIYFIYDEQVAYTHFIITNTSTDDDDLQYAYAYVAADGTVSDGFTSFDSSVKISSFMGNKGDGYVLVFVKPSAGTLITGFTADGSSGLYSTRSSDIFEEYPESLRALIAKADDAGYVAVFGWDRSARTTPPETVRFSFTETRPTVDVTMDAYKNGDSVGEDTEINPGDTITFKSAYSTTFISGDEPVSLRMNADNGGDVIFTINGTQYKAEQDDRGYYACDYTVTDADQDILCSVSCDLSYQLSINNVSVETSLTVAASTNVLVSSWQTGHVIYRFEYSEDAQNILEKAPDPVKEVPTDTEVYKAGDEFEVKSVPETIYDYRNHGVWTFDGWYNGQDEYGAEMSYDFPQMELSKVLTGTWSFTADDTVRFYTLSYRWTGCPDQETLYKADGSELTAEEYPVLPEENSDLVTTDGYTVDQTYTADTRYYTKDAEGNVTGAYVFGGWKYADGSDAEDGMVRISDIPLNGTWTYVPNYTVSYEVNLPTTKEIKSSKNASSAAPADDTEVADGASYEVATDEPDAIAPGTTFYTADDYGNAETEYTFLGWSTMQEYVNNGSSDDVLEQLTVVSDTTLYGIWTSEDVTKRYSLTYDDYPEDFDFAEIYYEKKADGTYVKTEVPEAKDLYEICVNGETYSDLDDSFTGKVYYTKDEDGNIDKSYTFKGWSETKGGTTPVKSTTFGKKDKVLYGIWTCKTYTSKAKSALSLNKRLKITQTGSKVNISFGEVYGAKGYKIYGAYCGSKLKLLKTVKTNKATITKLNGKKLNLKKNYKFVIVAYKIVNGKKVTIAKSITGHVVGRKNTKYTNAKSIKLTKTKFTLSVGKTANIKAKTTLVASSKKQLSNAHAKEFRYASSNKAIATVSASGKIKAVKKGTCYIYVFSRNGLAKRAKVTVK